MRHPGLLLAVVLAVLSAGGPSTATEGGYVIIVHPDNPATSVDGDFLRGAYLRKKVEWGDGTTIRPIDLPPRNSARERFTREVLHKTPAQLRNYWTQQVFSGKGVPPPVAESASAAAAYVQANPGAIGYLPAGVDPGRAKVITLR